MFVGHWANFVSEILLSHPSINNYLWTLLSPGIRDRTSSEDKKNAVSSLVISLFPHGCLRSVLESISMVVEVGRPQEGV